MVDIFAMKRPFAILVVCLLGTLLGCYRTAIVPRPLPPQDSTHLTGGDTAIIPTPYKSITSFVIKAADNPGVLQTDVIGIIILDSVKLFFNKNTDISNLIPTIGIAGKSVSPASMVAENFDSTVIYTVTATDGSQWNWRVVAFRQ